MATLTSARRPRLVVEVLSPTTERTDRHEKLAAYKNCPSVEEYVLVSQDAMMVELHRRAGGEWRTEIFNEPSESCAFDSVGLTLGLADIYRNVRFDETPVENVE
ncbi:MAG TPA: Uma2 family endonuclease [Pyrinomonadaceae bacterium]|nr:Uma2 family endonuclease [Pyrinomonadaceae bacterium]